MTIPFNKPFDCTAAFHELIAASFDASKLFSGVYAAKVREYFKKNHGAEEVVLTSACTRALELAALLLDLQPGDEVIAPAYTYVSTANAFELYGGKVKFCDSAPDSPNMDLSQLETHITPKTRAVVVVHYAGFSVDMYALLQIVRKHNLILIEDAAQGIHAFYDGKPLGAFGDMATFSFHETKNVTCGQGGALLINNKAFAERAIVLKNCGTNRHRFMLGLEDKYTWIDSGSVFNLPELCCAYLSLQLTDIEAITNRRKQLWTYYYTQLLPFQGLFKLPKLNPNNDHNAHIFYIVLPDGNERDALLHYLKTRGIISTFHYLGLHSSPYYTGRYGEQAPLPHAEKFAKCLLRLPLFHEMTFQEQAYIVRHIGEYFEQKLQTKTRPAKQLVGRVASHLIGLPLLGLLEEFCLNGFFA
ncbi:MAG: dTDP-4-amino-4,6-dideoxygalactose transaminase [Saprospirales bacterium]|nr:dTDP-4-amino-4,6-dideoxygalactose transaminase [Saprospirales bacterium]